MKTTAILILLLVAGCRNPFFPRLGEPQSYWTDQTTVGGLLQNFRNAYNFQDSLRYAECLACPDFEFQFYDPELGDYDWMSREVDLTTTGRLFRHYEDISLEWSGLDPELMAMDSRNDTLDVAVFFDLRLDNDYLNGWARFKLLRPDPPQSQSADCQSVYYPDSSVFRILLWQDDN